MSNRNQFVRQTAAVFLVFCLILCLLPGLATAQDWSTQEARAAWLIGQYEGESIGYNAKFGAAAALARLVLNPNDAEVIDRITHFYDKVPAGSNAQQFSYPGVAWVLGKYWDKFTPAERDHLKAKLKSFDDLLGAGPTRPGGCAERTPARSLWRRPARKCWGQCEASTTVDSPKTFRTTTHRSIFTPTTHSTNAPLIPK